MMTIAFTVYGIPQPGGSKNAFKGKGMRFATITDANKKAAPWKACVADAALKAYTGPLLDGALRVTMTFYRPRPKGHIGKRGIKASAPMFPTTKPDALKTARSTEDALTGIIWRDDAQTVDLDLRKRYGEPARAEIVIESLTPA